MSTLRITPLYGSYSHHPKYPSPSPAPIATLIEYASLRLLMDCGYDTSLTTSPTTTTTTAPPIPDNIDAILLCNSTLASLGGLPLYFPQNKPHPPIYSTFPTTKMGQMTLYDTHANACLDGDNLHWNLDDVDALFSSPRFHNLKYSQSATLHVATSHDNDDDDEKKPALTITPHRAGHVVGASFWILQRLVDDAEIVYAPTYHHSRERHLDPYELLRFGSTADVLVTRPGGPGGMLGSLYRSGGEGEGGGGGRRAVLQPPLVARAEGELVESVLGALRRGGNVLIPVDASGRVLELVLLLGRVWEKQRLGSAYNLCWVGPMTTNTIEYARSQLEWMAAPLGEQFDSQRGHPYSLKSMHILSSLPPLLSLLNTSKNPTCVLASGATLDNGPSRDLLLKWADNPDNLILLTDYSQCTLRSPPSHPSPLLDDADDIITATHHHHHHRTSHHASHLSSPTSNAFTTAGQLLLKWCIAKSMGVEMNDVSSVDVLVPHRSPLRGRELDEFLKEEEEASRSKRAEEERRAMLREVELARGRLRLGENEEGQRDPPPATVSSSSKSTAADGGPPPRKKSKFDSHLFLKFSKPLHMTFEVREEAVGIGQSDSIAKYGVNESVGLRSGAQYGGMLEEDYGLVVEPDRFVDIVTGIDPSKYGGGKLVDRGEDTLGMGFWKKGFGSTGGVVDGGPHNRTSDNNNAHNDNDEENPIDDAALEAADLSEGRGIIRGRRGRPHVKVATVPRRMEILAEIAYVPLEGRVDARAARQSVRALQPRQVVILGGGRPNDEEREWMERIKKSANRSMYDDFDDDDDDDDDEEELWGSSGNADDEDEEDGNFVGETRLLADAVRELTARVYAPRNGETIELSVGHAAYAARLIDTPYRTKEEKAAQAAREQQQQQQPKSIAMMEPFEVKMGDCTVSLLDYVATGQRVAADGSIVLAPRAMLTDDDDDNGGYSQSGYRRPTVMLSDGDVLLTDLRSEVIAQGMKAEYSAHLGYQQLVVNNKIIVKKEQSTGKINIEGPLCQDFYTVRSVVCSQYVTL